jgi:hypothetical protein
MDNHQSARRESLLREKALYRYMDAFERGDFENMSRILQQAERDPELEELIWGVQTAYLIEHEAERQENDIALVLQLLQKHLPSGLAADEGIEEIPPLTVSDVAARMQADGAVEGPLNQELHGVVQQLRRSTIALPSNLGLQGIRTLFAGLGVRASKRMQKLFSETALYLSAGRAQGIAQLAATRRQQEQAREQRKQQNGQREEEQS